jgi:hypothetical protein
VSEYASGVLDRLRRGSEPFGDVEIGEERIEVASVTPGAETDVRHLLESAVLQANADLAAPEENGEEERSDEDQQMTDAFREFAPPPEDDGGND